MKLFILGLLAFTQPAFAALPIHGEPMHRVLSCHTPDIYDGGYSVTLFGGGASDHQVAKVEEITFFGASEIGAYFVALNSTNEGTLYIDQATRGRDFSLALYGTERPNSTAIRARLNADTHKGRVSVDLSCEPLYHILNEDLE